MLWPSPGSIVYVRFLGFLRHKGIVSNRWWNGKPLVIASAQDTSGVAEVPWDTFTGRKPWFVEGYPSELPPHIVLYNARTLIGQPYNPLTANCEHFVHRCHGQQPNSPQAASIIALGLLGLLIATAK